MNINRYMDALACIKKSPRTVPELCELVDISEKSLVRALTAASGEGLIEPFGFMPTKPGDVPKVARTVWMWSK